MLLLPAILFPFPGTTIAWGVLKVVFMALAAVPIVGPILALVGLVM